MALPPLSGVNAASSVSRVDGFCSYRRPVGQRKCPQRRVCAHSVKYFRR